MLAEKLQTSSLAGVCLRGLFLLSRESTSPRLSALNCMLSNRIGAKNKSQAMQVKVSQLTPVKSGKKGPSRILSKKVKSSTSAKFCSLFPIPRLSR